MRATHHTGGGAASPNRPSQGNVQVCGQFTMTEVLRPHLPVWSTTENGPHEPYTFQHPA